jgi:hypothetical protein
MTSSQHASYTLGVTRNTMVWTISSDPAKASQSVKPYLSSDCSLKLDYMKPELLVIANQQGGGEYVPGSCTHRPSHHGSRFCPKSLPQPSGGGRLRQGL